jgi:type II secretory pathway pseudopilin PulG
MTTHATFEQVRDEGEAGYLLLAVVVLVAIILITLSVAAPIVAKDLRRDKEVESEHRAEQYVRAIRLYYRKTKSYPPSMDALLKGSNNIRYLRENYVDPLTGKADWRIIHQPKTKTHYPFGQELSGLAGGGLGSAAGLSSGIGTPVGGATTTVGQTSGLAAGFGGASVASPTSGGTVGSTGIGGTGANGTGAQGSGTSSSSSGIFGDSAGGVIYGVGPNRSGDSILNPNQQTTYDTWEFWYDPLIEQLYAKGNPVGGGGLGSQSAASFGQNAVTGQSNTPGAGAATTPPVNSPATGTATFP